jgi:hypothetical protein
LYNISFTGAHRRPLSGSPPSLCGGQSDDVRGVLWHKLVMGAERSDACSAALSEHGISIVIPTVSSPWTLQRALPHLLAALLRTSELQNERSEIILNHGTTASFEARAGIADLVRGTRLGKNANLSKLVHSFGPRAELFAASRFFAAAEVARYEVLVTIDDDVLNYGKQVPRLLTLLSCAVARETGFPLYTSAATPPGMHGTQQRFCGAGGYESAATSKCTKHDVSLARERWCARNALILLTNFAAFSRAHARRLCARFDEWYGHTMLRAHGNGEDIVFAMGTRRLGGAMVAHSLNTSQSVLHTLAPSRNTSYSLRGNHYSLRKVLCCCLSAGGVDGAALDGAALERCVFDAYDVCPRGDLPCVATRPSAAGIGKTACNCGRFHFSASTQTQRLASSDRRTDRPVLARVRLRVAARMPSRVAHSRVSPMCSSPHTLIRSRYDRDRVASVRRDRSTSACMLGQVVPS